MIERLIQDVRDGLRTMRRHPSVSTVAVVTLALGIGATTSIFSIVNGLLLRPLPFPDADRLVSVVATRPQANLRRDSTSFPDFSDWQHQSHAFTAMAAYRPDRFNITGDGTPEPLVGISASHDLLRVLGVSPALGRGFDEQEQHGKLPVVVIGHGLWTRRYGNDPGILGRAILINEVSHTVVGVLAPGFQFPAFARTDLIVPVPEHPSRSRGYIFGVARLQPGVHVAAAQQELDTIAAQLAAVYPSSNQGRGVSVVPLHDEAAGPVRTPLVTLLGAALLVLLIGCANVGHLVLASGLARQRELAVRSALGAGRGRLLRQLLTESVTLALVAALFGSLMAFWGSAFLSASLAQQFRLPAIAFDWALLAFAFVLALVSGLLSGLPPAIMAWTIGLNASLKHDSRRQSVGATERRLGRVLVVCQTALTVMLFIGAGLLVKSFIRLQQIDLGVDTHHVLTADLLLSKRYADPRRRAVFVQQLLDSVGAVPGAQAVAIHVDPPFEGGGRRETFSVEGRDDPGPAQGHPAGFDIVNGRFFHAMDLALVRGREFDRQDTAGSVPVAIVNETMARRFWPDQDAVGKRLRFFYDKNRERWLTIVGVVGDVRYRGRLMDPIPQVFVPGEQPFYKAQDAYISMIVRTAGDPAALVAAVQARIWAVDKDQPIATLQPLDQILWEAAAAPRIYMRLLSIFAAIALVIACAGIYGSSAYAVARRTQEIGIRLALGATRGQVLALVLRHGLLLIFLGVGIGVAGMLALTRVISGFLYGITATDTSTFLTVLLLFIGVAFCSTYLPARRAAAIDPTVAVRTE